MNQEIQRAFLLFEERFGYPKAWRDQRTLILEATRNESIGFAYLTERATPFMIVLTNSLSLARAESDLKELLADHPLAAFGVAMHGDSITAHRKQFSSGRIANVKEIESYKRIELLFDNLVRVKDDDECTLEPLSGKVENVFFDAHSYIRDIDGLHADECLDELCKIIYTKLYDEEITPPNSPYSLQTALYGSVEEFAAVIRDSYEEAVMHDVRVFGLKIPNYARSRGVFGDPIRLSSVALTRALSCIERYDLSRSPIDIKGRAFQRVLSPAMRSGMGQYFTPSGIVSFAVKILSPTARDLILDPFCGSAHFLSTSLKFVSEQHSNNDKSFHEFAIAKLHGIEKSDRMVRLGMTDMRLQGDGHSNIRCTDALLPFSNYPDLMPESFDIIMTNPPFGSVLGNDALAHLGEFDLSKNRKSIPLEIIGLERCIQFLRPGGRMAIVLPDGVLANRNSEYARSWLELKVKLRGIVSLPIETFTPLGANVKTSILFCRKWKAGEIRDKDYKVFLSRIDSIDSKRSDLFQASNEFNELLSTEGW